MKTTAKLLGILIFSYLLNGCDFRLGAQPNYRLIEIELSASYDEEGYGGVSAFNLDEDSTKELVVTQRNSISVYSIEKGLLWQKPYKINLSNGNGYLPGYHASGIQFYEDPSEVNTSIIFLDIKGNLVQIDSGTGEHIKTVSVPKVFEDVGRWEHLLVANFTGLGDVDLLVQGTKETSRGNFRQGNFIAAFSISDLLNSAEAKPHWFRNDYVGPAHSGARIADINLDGVDEVVGASIIGNDGSILFRVDVAEAPDDHVDAVQVYDINKGIPGLEVLVLQENHGDKEKNGNNLFLFNSEKLLFQADYQHREAQNAAIGNFDLSLPGKEIWLRSRANTDQTPFVFGSEGDFLTEYSINDRSPLFWSKEGIEVIIPIYWEGDNRQLIAAKERHTFGDVAILDALNGEFLFTFSNQARRLYVADIIGDWREELVVINENVMRIYQNLSNEVDDRPSLWMQQHYKRLKHNSTYYN